MEQVKLNALIAMADEFDAAGNHKEAEAIDAVLKVVAEEEAGKINDEENKAIFAANEAIKKAQTACDKAQFYHIPLFDNEAVKEMIEAIEMLVKCVDDKAGEGEDKEASTQPILSKLADIADKLDEAGVIEAASKVDELIVKIAKDTAESEYAYDSKHHRELQVRVPKEKKEEKSEHHVKPYDVVGHSLQTRYCIDHPGVMLARISEGVFQCSLDGSVFNYETGFTTQDGTHISGGSISNQTPMATEYQHNDTRCFDSREKVLNTIN